MDEGNKHDRSKPQVGDLIRFRQEILRDGYVELWNNPTPEHELAFPVPFRLVPCRTFAVVLARNESSCKVIVDTHVGWVDDVDIESV